MATGIATINVKVDDEEFRCEVRYAMVQLKIVQIRTDILQIRGMIEDVKRQNREAEMKRPPRRIRKRKDDGCG